MKGYDRVVLNWLADMFPVPADIHGFMRRQMASGQITEATHKNLHVAKLEKEAPTFPLQQTRLSDDQQTNI